LSFKPDALPGELREPGVVDVAPVDDEDRPGRERERPGHRNFVAPPLRDHGVTGEIPLVVQEEVELHRPFGSAEGGPVEDTGAEIDHRGIQREQRVLEAELPAALGQRLAAREQVEEHRLVEGPGPMLVRVGQGGPLRRRNPQMAELPLGAGQAPADLPEGLRPAELAEEHGDELAPTGEAPGMALRPVLLDRPLELDPGEQLQELTEDTHEAHHRWASSPARVWDPRPIPTIAGGGSAINAG